MIAWYQMMEQSFCQAYHWRIADIDAMDMTEVVAHYGRLRQKQKNDAQEQVKQALLNWKMTAMAFHSEPRAFGEEIDRLLAQQEGRYDEEIGDVAGLAGLKAEAEVSKWRRRGI